MIQKIIEHLEKDRQEIQKEIIKKYGEDKYNRYKQIDDDILIELGLLDGMSWAISLIKEMHEKNEI